MQKEIRQTWHFNRPPQEVWDYLTKPELLEQWFTKTDFIPRAGHQFRFKDKWGKFIHCEVVEARPFSKLSYTWQYASLAGDEVFDSTVAWTLVPTDDGTELQLLHGDFTTQEDFMAHTDGWTRLVSRLTGILSVVTSNSMQS
ncbi:MAG TPA: SRPBCC domain-containing protein [Puia sp.]|nr:SRPBCC domain-containing protein [Puia sp.]